MHLGEMHVVASMENVYRRIFNHFLIILSFQAFNVFVVSLLVFIFFFRMVGRHIISLASFTESIHLDSTYQPFRLDRKNTTEKIDELDQLATPFNRMRETLAEDTAA